MSKFYCPKCKSQLEEHSSCGSVSFFCDQCKGLVSRNDMLTEEALKVQDVVDEAEK